MRPETLYPATVLTASAAALAVGLTAQYGFDLEPCILCLYQRIPFIIAGLLAIGALALPLRRRKVAALLALAGLALLVNAGIAVYHVGVEQHWWASTCAGQAATEMTLEQMMASLNSKPTKACDDVSWTMLGLSAASWNVPFSSLFGLYSLWGARRLTLALGRQAGNDAA